MPDGAKFCPECGGRVAAVEPSVEQRKTVTVLFSDVTGSTGLGERLDPESMRRVLARLFELARSVIEAHGGTVEKFVGDAVMAIFGVPVLHEDDALRAVRAAAELHRALAGLNEELGTSHGVALELRTGVNTGEVVTGTAERLATGDAVNVAARLQQLASPGEVLLGERVVELVRDAASVEEIGPVELKGKTGAVVVYRLLGVEDTAPGTLRPHTAPLVGRSFELHLLADAFGRVVREGSCGLFTLLGAAGVGKSRLAEEFVATVDATVVQGRCLSYGEGITYWPVVQVVKELLGADRDVASLLHESPEVRAGVAALFGEADAATSSSEIAWAVRKILERAATERPLVVVVDDLHWGEPTLFDLIEHVTDLSRSAPLFLLCIARPEMMERRGGWGGGKLNATTVLLEPLNEEETDALIDRLAGAGVALGPGLRTKLRTAAGGNPLFVEEMLTLVADAGEGEVRVPATIHALLSARLDQLEATERRVLERGSVEGQSFHLGAVQALSPGVEHVPSRLAGLVRKDLIRPERATLPGDDAYRFRHLLIRDAAYDGLAKSVRAELHAAFAAWLAASVPDLVELDEIVGYHLEQAVRYRRELGLLDEPARGLAASASTHLEAAGQRALDRGDMPAAVNLLERASALRPGAEVDVALELLVAQALHNAGALDAAVARADAAAATARGRGDRVSELEALLLAGGWRLNLEPEPALGQFPSLIEEARRELAGARDDAALAYLGLAVTNLDHYFCRFGSGLVASTDAMTHAEAAGLHFLARQARMAAVAALKHGPVPVLEAADRIAALQSSSFAEPMLDQMRAALLAYAGRYDEARALSDAALAAATERGQATAVALCHMNRWDIESTVGDDERALREGLVACEEFERMGERSWLSTAACMVAESLYLLGRYDEAEHWAHRGLSLGATDDIATQGGAAQVLGKVAARRGRRDEALACGARGLALVEGVESPQHHAEALFDLAEIHLLLGEEVEAGACLDAAVGQFEARAATALVERARRRFSDLHAAR
jgi:predicted ATPase/class 3 adenylate cyclase